MPRITTPIPRKVIEDFAKEIREKKMTGAKPERTVINFRDDQLVGRERPIVKVPAASLRFRKDNGRIASDVLDYETNVGPLDETDDEAQNIIREFLKRKDPERTEDLRKTIMHSGQRDPAIITCDGFLINGNRRKMVLDELKDLPGQHEDFHYMKVVVLPGPGEEGGAPTILEIEQIENRYQLQSDGKAEYYGFDRALSIRRKIQHGFTLEAQLQDDPRYAGATPVELKREALRITHDFLEPLDCVDRYLETFNRQGFYSTISKGSADPAGRWQAFTDYSKAYQHLSDAKFRLQAGIAEDEVGTIEDAAFKIIRLRELKGLSKVHNVMRELPRLCGNPHAKKEVLKISDEVEVAIPRADCTDKDGKELGIDDIDRKWGAKFQEDIIHRVKKALDFLENQKDKDKPMSLLEAAHDKLMHHNMLVSAIAVEDFKRARELASLIQKRANEIENEIYHFEKDHKELRHKK